MYTNDLNYLRTVQFLDDIGELVHDEDRRALDDYLIRNRVNRVPEPYYPKPMADDYYFL